MGELKVTTEVGIDPCKQCGSESVSYNGIYEGFVCADCGHRWADTTPSERACIACTYGDTVEIKETGQMLEVMQNSPRNDELSAIPMNGTPGDDAHRFSLNEEGQAENEDGEKVTLVSQDDPWSGNRG